MFAVSQPAEPDAQGRNMAAETFDGSRPLRVDFADAMASPLRVALTSGPPIRNKSSVFMRC